MPKFSDSQGRDWPLVISIAHVGELKRDAGFDLGKAGDEVAFAKALFGDPVTIANVLWVLVRKGAGSVTQEEFFAALDPDAVERATDALLEAIADFFHRRRSGPVKARIPELMAAVDKAHEKKMQSIFNATLKRLVGGSLESPESETPAG